MSIGPRFPVAASVRLVPKRDDADAARPTAAELRLAKGMPQQDMSRRRAGSLAPAPVAAAAAMPADAIGYAANAAESEDASTQVLFRFPSKVSLAAGSTMMVPFVDRNVAATRTWLYQPQTNAHHPLAAVRLRNDGDSALPPGLITAFDSGSDGAANFAGDAQLPLTPKGDAKFITFALDGKTDIRREDRGIKETRLGKVVNGVLTLSVRALQTMDYEITSPPDEDREVVIEEARGDGWKPVAETKDVEETAARLRYKVSAPRGRTTKATLVLERLERETIALSTLGAGADPGDDHRPRQCKPGAQGRGVKLGALVADLNSAKARRAESCGRDEADRRRPERASAKISRRSARSSDLGRRYVDALRKQEDRLAEIAAADKALETEMADKRKAAGGAGEDLVREADALPYGTLDTSAPCGEGQG